MIDELLNTIKNTLLEHHASNLGYNLQNKDSLRQMQIDEMALRSMLQRRNLFGGTRENPPDSESAQAPANLDDLWKSQTKLQMLQKLLEHAQTPMMPTPDADLSPPTTAIPQKL